MAYAQIVLENRKDDATTAAEREQYELNMVSQVGLNGYYIGKDLEGNEAVSCILEKKHKYDI